MINNKRLEKTFTDLVRIPGLSMQEGRIASEVIKRLTRLRATVKQDKKVMALGYQTGNIVATIKGEPGREPIMLCAHLDTVGPADKIEFRKKGSIIESTGKSILGADDRSGIAAILEVLTHFKEEGFAHPTIEVVLTVGEEIGLIGAKNINRKLIKSKRGLVLDSTDPLEVVVAAPAAYRMRYTVTGREAHAGINPEQGVNAIQVAAKGIAKMKLGRINKDTTANIGLVQGGRALNIVPCEAVVEGEARSHNPDRLERQVKHMRECMNKAVDSSKIKVPGIGTFPKLKEDIRLDYPAMKVNPKGKLMSAIKKAGKDLGLEAKSKAGGGGSDANIFNDMGIECVIIGTGMDRVHSTKERINLKDLTIAAKLVAGSVMKL